MINTKYFIKGFFCIKANLLSVSEGFGSHLPEPCSVQLGPLDKIVPDGNKKKSTHLRPPCSFYCNLSKFTIEASISIKV
mgnify:CR=1 FL=1